MNANVLIDPLTRVLLIENDPVEATLIQGLLAGNDSNRFDVEWVPDLSCGLDRLSNKTADIVLLDLALPDGKGVAALDQVSKAAPDALILVLSAKKNEALAQQALQHGAHDYFNKDHVDAHWLPRVLRYALERKVAQSALLESETRFRAMSDASPLGIFVSDAEANCIYTNAAYHKISGLTLEQTLGTKWSTAIHPEDRQRVLAEWGIAARQRAPFKSEVRFLRGDGSVVWTRLNSAAMDAGRMLMGHVQIVEDITSRKSAELILHGAEEALFEEKERAQVTLNSIGDAVVSTNLEGLITYLNPVAEKMTGWPHEDALGRPLEDVLRIVDGKTKEIIESPAQHAINDNGTVKLAKNCFLVHRDGSESAIEDSAAPIHNRDGQVAGAVIVFHDVTEAKAMALKMAELAQHDFLTGLPNRLLLVERLSQAMGQADRHNKKVALLFLDLDYFKHVNDSLGHGVGDLLLQSVATRLGTCVRATDTVCRQGGDEFVLLLSEIEMQNDAIQVAEKLLAAFELPHQIEGNELYLTLSIGISIYPDNGTDANAVMQKADIAMYHAKDVGRNNYQCFTAAMSLAERTH